MEGRRPRHGAARNLKGIEMLSVEDYFGGALARGNLSTIAETSSEPSRAAGARSSHTRLELEQLQQEVDRLRACRRQEAGRTSSASSSRSSDAELRALTSSRTRQELEIVKRELEAMKVSKAVKEKRHSETSRSSRQQSEELRIVIRKASALDLAFLVDATGSMQNCIDLVKDKIAEIAAAIWQKHPESTLRVAFACYRDYDDAPHEPCDFTSSFEGKHSTFVTSLSQVRAVGGGDEAEDVFSGLESAGELGWRAPNRVLIHIGDAPCHGRQFHDGAGDKHPSGDIRGRNVATLLRSLRDDCRISCYTFCHLNDSTHKMLREFKKSLGGSDSGWIQQETFDNISDIPMKVVAVAKETIASTLTRTVLGHGKPEKYIVLLVHSTIPSWTGVVRQQATQHRTKWYGTLEQLLDKVALHHNLELEKMPDVAVQIAPHPFSSDGAVRWPYYAQVRNLKTDKTFPMVVKRFKEPSSNSSAKLHSKDRYLEQMEVQTVSAQMAEEFNKKMNHLAGAKQVTFSMVTTLELRGNDGQGKFYNMEKVLKGSWIKYSNNAGYVNTADYAATLQAFTHWTHERSKGLLMVTDLQGVRVHRSRSGGDSEFWLCDPAIHCADTMRFTRTNLGETGFQLFYGSHKCNDVCRNLKLKPGTNGYTSKGTVLGV